MKDEEELDYRTDTIIFAHTYRGSTVFSDRDGPLICYREDRLMDNIGDGCWWTAPAPTED